MDKALAVLLFSHDRGPRLIKNNFQFSVVASLLSSAIVVAFAQAQDTAEPQIKPAASSAIRVLPNVEGVELFRIESRLLSHYWGRPIFLEAGVVLPPEHDRSSKNVPVCYSIHGFGGSHHVAWLAGPSLRKQMQVGDYPRFIYVFLNARCPLGHHEFADSVNNGPWGQALTEELVPALEQAFGAAGTAQSRFLTGHSSGGWSSLWLQITYPDFFNGTWSTAPDSVDFRDFTGVDIYRYDNAYFDPTGQEIPLSRKRGSEQWAMTIKEYAQQEAATKPYGGQMASFDAVFSPRGEDGRPMQLYDRETGTINRFVAQAWEKYDIRLALQRRWQELEPKLRGKINVFIGDLDTYRLEGAVRLFKAELESLGSDANIIIVEGRDHASVKQPHPEWPNGLQHRIHHEMWSRWNGR
jgi:hypothetical protein